MVMAMSSVIDSRRLLNTSMLMGSKARDALMSGSDHDVAVLVRTRHPARVGRSWWRSSLPAPPGPAIAAPGGMAGRR